MKPRSHNNVDASIRRQAAEWLVRRDRGLSAQESIEFELWLADDERHAAALQRARATWAMLDRIPEKTGQATVQNAARRRRIWNTGLWGSLAAAAVLAIALTPFGRSPLPTPNQDAVATTPSEWTSPQITTLSDGSLVRLNSGSEVLERFTAHERRVVLVRGEAHFTVMKNHSRPFIVQAGTVEARAVGTAFNMNLQSAAVEILVTEGTVAVSDRTRQALPIDSRTEPADGRPADVLPPRPDFVLTARQRAVVALTPISAAAAVVVTDLSKLEVTRALAWQEPLLRLSGATLADLAREFQRRTGYRLVIADPHLADLRTGGRFRGDDVEGFLRILEDNFGIKSETSADGAIVLRQAAPPDR